jgi:hypothetical protein
MKVYKKIFLGLCLLLLAAIVFRLPSSAGAFDPRTGERVVIGKDEVIDDDVYVSANSSVLQGTIKGDLVAFGTMITIEPGAVIEGDLLAAGQAVIVNGEVKDDVRIAGFSLQIGDKAVIGSDLVAAGYSVETLAGSAVGRDLVAAGSQVALFGDVTGKGLVGAGGLRLEGSIGGDLNASLGEAADAPPFNPGQFMPQQPGLPPLPAPFGGLIIGSQAKVGGSLSYQTVNPVNIPAGVVGGQVTHTPTPLPAPDAPAAPAPPPTPLSTTVTWFLKLLRNMASLLVIGLLAAWLAPEVIRKGADVIQAQPFPSLLWGVVGYAAFFFALILLFVLILIIAIVFGIISLGDLVGLSVGLGLLSFGSLIMGFSVAASYLSKILVGYLVGRVILSKLVPDQAEGRIWPMVLGVVLFAILAAIPYLGALVNLIVVLLGLGALWIIARQWWEARKMPPAAIVVEPVAG